MSEVRANALLIFAIVFLSGVHDYDWGEPMKWAGIIIGGLAVGLYHGRADR